MIAFNVSFKSIPCYYCLFEQIKYNNFSFKAKIIF